MIHFRGIVNLMKGVDVRVGRVILGALFSASLLAVAVWGIYPDKPLYVYALIAFVIFFGWGWGRAEIQIHNIKRIEKYLNQLAELRAEGVKLRNKGFEVISIEEEDDWWTKVVQWKSQVVESMNRINTADGKNWATLGTVKMQTFDGIGSNRYETQRMLSMVTQWFEKLESYVNERTKLQP